MNPAIFPIIVPLLTALIALIWGKSSPGRRIFVGISAILQVCAAAGLASYALAQGIITLHVGSWGAPFGIVLVIDPLAGILLCLASIVICSALFFGFFETSRRVEHPLRLPLVQLLAMGINLAFVTGDLFNLFVAFEVMLIASYGLLTLDADDWEIKHAFPYIAINMFGSTLFLAAAGFSYSLFGTLNFADIANRSSGMASSPQLIAIAAMLMLVFSMKAGIFPLSYWLPNSYPTLPAPMAALYAALLTKVGIYALIRIFGTVMPPGVLQLHWWLALLAGVTMVVTIMGALARDFIRGILCFNLLSHIGFMALAIGFFTPMSFAAAIFYMTHHILVMASLFMIAGSAAVLQRTDYLGAMGNLWTQAPLIGVLFLFQGLSLAGIPPLSGFWGKYLIMRVGMEQGHYALVACVIIASILTLFSVLTIWLNAFWRKNGDIPPARVTDGRWPRLTFVPLVLTILSTSLGLGAEYGIKAAKRAADSIFNREEYVAAVVRYRGKEAQSAHH
jgi:multicomponent Na+:H+ antiporter subunit D